MSQRSTFALLLGAFELLFLILFGLFAEYGRHKDGLVQVKTLKGANDGEISSKTPNNTLTAPEKPPSNYIDDFYGVFQDVHVMMFIGFGFLMTFLKRYSFSSVGINFLLGAFVIQWATLVNGFFALAPNGFDGTALEVDIQSLILSDFAAAAVMITFGAVLGKASPSQLVVIAFVEVIFYGLNVMIGEHYFQAVDIGGSMLIHTFGAYFGLSLSGILDKKRARKGQEKESSVYHSDLFAMIGTIFLWMFWPSFNGALAADSVRHRAVVNTYFSLAGSVISTFIFSQLFHKRGRFEMVHVQNATLAGGVAVGNAANFVIGIWGATLVGFIAGFVSVVGYTYIQPFIQRKFRIHDTCGVHNLHGMPGIFGAVVAMIAIVAVDDDAYGSTLYEIFVARAPANESAASLIELSHAGWDVGAGSGRSASVQAVYHLATLAVTLALAIVGGAVAGGFAMIPCLNPVPDKDGQLFEDERNWEVPDELTYNIQELVKHYWAKNGVGKSDEVVDITATQTSV